jgi:hypothetical protein
MEEFLSFSQGRQALSELRWPQMNHAITTPIA